jgi:uncharacterized protein
MKKGYKILLEKILKEKFKGESSGHDFYHLERVYNMALHIQGTEGGDRLVIGTAAFLHDVHRLMQSQKGIFVHPKDSLAEVRGLLNQVNFPEEKIIQVLHCVEFHEEYSFSKNGRTINDLETLILQDADNLDAIGALGIGRTFAYGGANSVTLWIPEIPLDVESPYDESSHDPSTIHHFYHKLLRLGGNMNTNTGKQMAQARIQYMQEFLERFFKEWKGEI